MLQVVSHCLVRSHLEYGETELLLEGLVNDGLIGACECLSRQLPLDEDKPLRPCIFSAKLVAGRHVLHSSRARYPNLIKSNCRCLDILISDQTTIVFCSNKNSKISSRVAYNPSEFLERIVSC